MQPKTPPTPDVPDLEPPSFEAAAESPPRAEPSDEIPSAPNLPSPASLRIVGEWAEYADDVLPSSTGSVPPPRTSGFIRARRPASDVELGEFPFNTPVFPARSAPQQSLILALGPGVLLVAASVAMTFFDQRSFPAETLANGSLSTRPPTWIAALTCCLGLLSIALGARRFARGRYL